MSTSWSLKDLRNHILWKLNKDQYLLDLLNSVGRGVEIFNYHYFNAKESMDDFISEDDRASLLNIRRILGVSDSDSDFQIAQLENEANTIAAIYTIRSLYDQFSQLVRALLGLNELTESQCSIHKVRDKLELGELRSAIDYILISEGFKYINAFVNVTKHRSLVKYGALVDFENDRSGIKFNEFKYNKNTYPARWSNEVLRDLMETKNEIVNAGNILNKLLLE